jgi:pimeloyl-ACP methyl ester carboxylesterase
MIIGILLVVLVGVVLLSLVYWAFLQSMYPETLRSQEIHTVITKDLWKLRLVRYREGRVEGEPVLLIPGAALNQHTFSSPARSCLVDYLVDKGYDCWVLDLRGSRSAQTPFERNQMDVQLDEYLHYDLPDAALYIRQKTGYERLHWVGHSLGGTLIYAYAQAFGETHISSAVTLGAPIGFEGTQLAKWQSLRFMLRHCPRLSGNVIRALVPLYMALHLKLRAVPVNRDNLHDSLDATDVFGMIETPLPKVFDELLFWVDNKVVRMRDDGLDVVAGLKHMTFPLLAFYGETDPFVSIDYAQRFMDSLPHNDKKMLVCSKDNGFSEDYDHGDLLLAKAGGREIFAPIAQWFANHPNLERVRFEEEDEQYRPPLNDDERAGILSGTSYGHFKGDITPWGESSRTVQQRLPGTQPKVKSSARKKKAAPKKKTAAKAKAPSTPKKKVSAKKKSAAKPSAKKKAAAKKKSAPKVTVKAKTKTPARKKAAAKKKSPARSASKAKTKTSTGKKPAKRKNKVR